MRGFPFTTSTGNTTSVDSAAIYRLAARMRGQLLLPDDGGYERARKVWNGLIDHRPGVIASCATPTDVVEAVRFAREHDLRVSVRGGGHNIAGKAVCDGGVMIDQSRRRAVTVDVGSRTARVEAGATLGELDAATQAAGLATTAGVVTHTGVAGLTLGGGVGRLARKHGLACDNLVSVDVVTADGRIVTASEAENAELFWGMRGAGANFGVATAFTFRLHPVGPEVLGGAVVHGMDKAPEALRFYSEFSRSAPDELSADAIFLTSPDGHRVFVISACYIGSVEEGEAVLEPLRRFGPPLFDDIAPVPYTAIQAVGDQFFPIGLNYYWKSQFLEKISDDAVEATVEHFSTVPSTRSLIVFQQYGGAVSRVAPSQTAYRHRNAQYDAFAASVWTEADDTETQTEWVRQWRERVAPFGIGAEYVNNLGEEGADRVRAAYGDNYQRLVALKNEYDPENFFRLNANIEPTG